jgi:8-oxo-dGTP diphosphatase
MSRPPLYPVVTVRAFATDDVGRILLLRRAKSAYGEGAWCLPGGKVDYGESPEQALARELREETGLATKEVSFLFFQNSPPIAAGGMHCLNLYFRCTVEGEVKLNEESCEHTWLTMTEALARKPVFGAEAAIRRLL